MIRSQICIVISQTVIDNKIKTIGLELLAIEMPISQIAEITKLSIEEIEKLTKK